MKQVQSEPSHEVALFKIGRSANEIGFLLGQALALSSPSKGKLPTRMSYFKQIGELLATMEGESLNAPDPRALKSQIGHFHDLLGILKGDFPQIRRKVYSEWHKCRFERRFSWGETLSSRIHDEMKLYDLTDLICRSLWSCEYTSLGRALHSLGSDGAIPRGQRAYVLGVVLDTAIHPIPLLAIRYMASGPDLRTNGFTDAELKRISKLQQSGGYLRWLSQRPKERNAPYVVRCIAPGHVVPRADWKKCIETIIRPYPWSDAIAEMITEFTRPRSVYCGGSKGAAPPPTQETFKTDRVSQVEGISASIIEKLSFPSRRSNANRDQWFYEQLKAGRSLKDIETDLRKMPFWTFINKKGISRQAHKFALERGLYPLKSNAGRPRKR